MAVKDSTGDFQAVSRLIAEAPSGFEVYSGDDWAAFGYACLGAVGVVSVASHLVGPQIHQMLELVGTGDVPAARKIHEQLSPLFNALFITSNPIPVKAALDDARPPRGRAAAAARARDGRGAGAGPHRTGGRRSPLTRAICRVVFLGGVGEVGRNMACVELDGRILIIDVGLSFPSGDMPGIDLVLPDFDYVRSNADRVEAIVLTHGHEDHIGALPYLLREIDRRARVRHAVHARAAEGQARGAPGEPIGASCARRCRARARRVGPFSMRFLRVTHSIPDGMAVVVDTPYGAILHTGDFKIDQTPLDGRPTDLHGLAEEASGRGVHLLLSDSTNAEEAGYTDSERSGRPGAAAHRRERARDRGGGLLLEPHPPRPADRERGARERARRRLPRPVDAELGRRRPPARATCRSTTAT